MNPEERPVVYVCGFSGPAAFGPLADPETLSPIVSSSSLYWGSFSMPTYLLSLDLLKLVSALREAKLRGQYRVMI